MGKGAPEYFVVKPGRIMFEIAGVLDVAKACV